MQVRFVTNTRLVGENSISETMGLFRNHKPTVIQNSGKGHSDEVFDCTCKYGKQSYFKTTILNSTTETSDTNSMSSHLRLCNRG